MKRFNIQLTAAVLIGFVTHGADAQTVYEFTNAGPATWYSSANWSNSLVPTYTSAEIGAVNNNRTAFVDSAMADGTFEGVSANPGAVRIGVTTGLGTGSVLEIRNGGTFHVQPDGATITTEGVTVGFLGSRGILRVLPGGSMTADARLFVDNTVAPNAASRVEVGGASGGTATLNVGSATIGGVLQTYANSDFNVTTTLNFLNSGVLRPEIKSASNAKVDVTGAATLAGTLTADFTGFTPTFGQNWTVLEAASIGGNFAAVNSPILGLGQTLFPSKVTIGGGRQQLKVTFGNSLILNVNRDTGAMSLGNPNSPNISLDGYSIRSASGKLNSVAWTSLDDTNALGGDWRESNASANQLAELKPTTSGTITGNNNQSMGNSYNPLGSAFGTGEDLVFDYTLPDGSVVPGTVVYTGTRVNNLLLQVDPANGHSVLRNTSATTVNIDGYDIASATSSLSTSGWNSLDDQNAAGGDWRESDVSAARLAELKPTSSATLAPNASFDLGNLFNTSGTRDLTFNFLQGGNSVPTLGAVIYQSLAGVQGDYNSNGIVDAADYTVWRDHLGQTFPLPNEGTGISTGTVTIEDYNFWKTRFGMTSGSGSGGSATSSAVPEPACWLIALTAAAGCAGIGHRRDANRA